jgi:RNA polymerase sigma-70 factor (ECF subfamily)
MYLKTGISSALPRRAGASDAIDADAIRAPAAAPTLESLYRAHFDFVWRTIKRLGVAAAQLDDAAQEVFLVVHRQLESYEGRNSERAWLFSIARRVASDQRRASRRKECLPLPGALRSDAPDGLRAAMNKERADIVLDFLQTLEDDPRDAFILCELEQMSAPEIALAVNATTSAVYSRIRVARAAFAHYVRSRHPELIGDDHG